MIKIAWLVLWLKAQPRTLHDRIVARFPWLGTEMASIKSLKKIAIILALAIFATLMVGAIHFVSQATAGGNHW